MHIEPGVATGCAEMSMPLWPDGVLHTDDEIQPAVYGSKALSDAISASLSHTDLLLAEICLNNEYGHSKFPMNFVNPG